MHISARAAVAAAAILLCPSNHQASADEQPVLKPLNMPIPASVVVPHLDATAKDDYAYFFKSDVSYETAFTELDECRMYSLEVHFGKPPRFVPLGSAAVKGESLLSNQSAQSGLLLRWGLVGSLFADALIQSAEDDAADTANRRCMMYKGYSRYGITRATWKHITTGTDAEKLARLALIASGPQPTTGALGQ